MNTTSVNYQFEKKGFGWGWVLVNILGTYIGLITAYRLNVGFARYWTLPAKWAAYIENHSLLKAFPTVAAVAGGILVGNLVIGLGEQMIIRRHTHLSTLWFPATAIGAVIIAVYSMLSAQPGYYFLTNEIFRLDLFPLLWLSNGLLQWLVMRKMVTHSSNWIWITVLSFFGFLVVFFPLAFIAFFTIMDITDGNQYYYVLKPYVHDTTEMANLLDYYFALFVLPFPVVASALIRGLFIKNRLKTSAQQMDLNRVVQRPKNDQPPIVPG